MPEGTFLLPSAYNVHQRFFSKQDKACRVLPSIVSPMNCWWKYLIGVDSMMNIAGTTDVDGTSYCEFVGDGDTLCLNGQLT